VASWPEAPRLNFGLSENLLVRNFSSKNANFEAGKLLFWGNLGSKLKFRAPMVSSVTLSDICSCLSKFCEKFTVDLL